MAMPAMAPPESEVPLVEPVAGAALPLRSAIELAAAGTVMADERSATEMNVGGTELDDADVTVDTEAESVPVVELALTGTAPIVTC